MLSRQQAQNTRDSTPASPAKQKTRTDTQPGMEQQLQPATIAQRIKADPRSLSRGEVMHLQRTIGNRAVGKLLRGANKTPIQPKLTINQPGDKYEKEADRVADQVMRMPEPVNPLNTTSSVQRQEEEEQEPIQAKPLAQQITPLVQRQAEEGETAQAMVLQRQIEEEEESLQRQSEVEEEEIAQPMLLQRQTEEEEPLQGKFLQRQAEKEEEPRQNQMLQCQAEEEEEPLQAKPVQRQTEEEEETPLQAKPLMIQRLCPECEKERPEEEGNVQRAINTTPAITIQRLCPKCREKQQGKPGGWPLQRKPANGSANQASPTIESNINAMKGGGTPLPKATRSFFESRFGADFSGVRVHTDNRAAETAKSINARAFTAGSSIAFGSGQYAPETSSGKKLLAHELTHVVQQESGPFNTMIQKNRNSSDPQDISDIQQKLSDANSVLKELKDNLEEANKIKPKAFRILNKLIALINKRLEKQLHKINDWRTQVGDSLFLQFERSFLTLIDSSKHSVLQFITSKSGLGFAGSFMYMRMLNISDIISTNRITKEAMEANKVLGSLTNMGSNLIMSMNNNAYYFIIKSARYIGKVEGLMVAMNQAVGGMKALLEIDVNEINQTILNIIDERYKEVKTLNSTYKESALEMVRGVAALNLVNKSIPKEGEKSLRILKLLFLKHQGLKGTNSIVVKCKLVNYFGAIQGFFQIPTIGGHQRTKRWEHQYQVHPPLDKDYTENLKRVAEFTIPELRKIGFNVKLVIIGGYLPGLDDLYNDLETQNNSQIKSKYPSLFKHIFSTPIKNMGTKEPKVGFNMFSDECKNGFPC